MLHVNAFVAWQSDIIQKMNYMYPRGIIAVCGSIKEKLKVFDLFTLLKNIHYVHYVPFAFNKATRF